MTLREGNLEAPTRHPIDWRSADFHDEGKATADGEVHGVDKKDYAKVVEQCYLCDLCYMTKCPYVPPHPWNVDFPHLMLRAKAIRYGKGEVGAGAKLLASTDVHGQLAGIPIVVQAVNAANRTQPMRKVLQAALDIHPDAWLPPLASRRFRGSVAKKGRARRVVDGERSPGKVALFASCLVNYNEPGIGRDLVAVLEHNEIPYQLVDKESCCGMPKLELGDLEGVARLKEKNIPVLARYAREGFAILTAIPSCTLMFKQELPLM